MTDLAIISSVVLPSASIPTTAPANHGAKIKNAQTQIAEQNNVSQFLTFA